MYSRSPDSRRVSVEHADEEAELVLGGVDIFLRLWLVGKSREKCFSPWGIEADIMWKEWKWRRTNTQYTFHSIKRGLAKLGSKHTFVATDTGGIKTTVKARSL